MLKTILITVTAIGITALIVWILMKRIMDKEVERLYNELGQAKSSLRSAFVRFGKTWEHFAPITKNFPANKETSVFLGMPLDYICFDEDTIKFIDVKTGQAKLTPKQNKIKRQIEDGKIEFIELRY